MNGLSSTSPASLLSEEYFHISGGEEFGHGNPKCFVSHVQLLFEMCGPSPALPFEMGHFALYPAKDFVNTTQFILAKALMLPDLAHI